MSERLEQMVERAIRVAQRALEQVDTQHSQETRRRQVLVRRLDEIDARLTKLEEARAATASDRRRRPNAGR